MYLSGLRDLEVHQLAALIAARRVERGRRWLNRHAQPGWYRNLFEPSPDGRSYCRVHVSYDNECPLALAFESQASFANEFGYVTEAQVVRHFNLSPRWLRAHGNAVLERDPASVSTAMLNSAWNTLLRDQPGGSGAAYRHPTAIDRRFAEMDFSAPSRHGLFQRWFGWLRPASA